MSPAEQDPIRSVPRWLLLAGALAGIALAAFGLYEIDASQGLPGDAVASVNGRAIALADYRQLLLALEQDRREGLRAEDREWVLERMIEEELLVQRALEIGLLESDPSLRQAAVRAMVATITADVAATEPDDEELLSFFERERERFQPQPRYHVRRLRFADTGETGLARARRARSALAAGAELEALRADADPDLAAPPDALLPPSKLVEYLGPEALERAAALRPGALTEVFESGGDWVVLQLVDKETPPAVEMDAVRDEVLAEWRRARIDEEFRRYLDDLLGQATVERAESLP